MNHIENKHLEAFQVFEPDFEYNGIEFIECFNTKLGSIKSAEVTEEIAIEFYEWADTSDEAARFWRRNRVDPDMSGKYHDKVREKRKLLFQEFLKSKE